MKKAQPQPQAQPQPEQKKGDDMKKAQPQAQPQPQPDQKKGGDMKKGDDMKKVCLHLLLCNKAVQSSELGAAVASADTTSAPPLPLQLKECCCRPALV